MDPNEARYELLNAIVSGPLDADKLDYLIRDSLATGVPYGKTIDENRLYQCLCVIRENNELYLGVTAKGRPALESIMTARYELFTEVYWHKTSRAATSMIKLAFELAKPKRTIKNEFSWTVMMLDDKDFMRWLSTKLTDEIGSDLLGNLSFSNRHIYKRLKTYASTYKTPIKRNIFDKFMRISDRTKELEKIKRSLINDINGSLPKHTKLRPHHLIIDVPSNSADRGSDIKIQYPPNVGKADMIFNLKEISPIGSIQNTV
jgi:HD superfamily phosphohydrolase